jgi:hypothetical protein
VWWVSGRRAAVQASLFEEIDADNRRGTLLVQGLNDQAHGLATHPTVSTLEACDRHGWLGTGLWCSWCDAVVDIHVCACVVASWTSSPSRATTGLSTCGTTPRRYAYACLLSLLLLKTWLVKTYSDVFSCSWPRRVCRVPDPRAYCPVPPRQMLMMLRNFDKPKLRPHCGATPICHACLMD